MKKNIYSASVLCSISILILNIFTKSEHLTNIIVFSVNLFIKNIFPSVFPMFVLSSVLVEMGLPRFLGSMFNTLFKFLFKSSGATAFVFFMSMLTGFPSSAKYINDLIDKRLISKNEAEKILSFTFFSNPLFIINTVGYTFLCNKKVGLLILIAHVLGNIFTGLLFRNFNSRSKHDELIQNFSFINFTNTISNTNIFKAFLKSIKNSLEILINIFGIITFFLIIINMMFKTPDSFFEIFITGIVEMTTGLKYLSISNYSLNIKILVSTFFISFGGLSVHAQIMDILKEKKVNYLPFLFSRIIHSLISIAIIFLFTNIS